MVAVSSLTKNVCITHHIAYSYMMGYTVCEVTSSNVLGRNNLTGGGGLVHPKGE